MTVKTPVLTNAIRADLLFHAPRQVRRVRDLLTEYAAGLHDGWHSRYHPLDGASPAELNAYELGHDAAVARYEQEQQS